MKTDKSYHHGNLRDALIIAAAEIIESGGAKDFAMIDAARLAGVSSAAPYRHFKDKDALLQAVSEFAFMALTEFTEASAAPYAPGTAERIIALGKGYIRFIISNPNFYELMWTGQSGDTALKVESELKTSGFYVLADAVQSWCSTVGVKKNDPIDLSVKLWAMAHGLGSLGLNQHTEKFMPNVDVYALLEEATRTFLSGLDSEKTAGSR